jgi:hypothetical protein
MCVLECNNQWFIGRVNNTSMHFEHIGGIFFNEKIHFFLLNFSFEEVKFDFKLK